MNENSLQTSFWTMILIQTIGSVDMPGRGPRKMPAPRQYVAIIVTWLVLQLIASISANAARATAAVGWLFVLAGLIIGPFGQQLVNFFTIVSDQFAATGSFQDQLNQAASNLGPPPAKGPQTLTPFPPASSGIR